MEEPPLIVMKSKYLGVSFVKQCGRWKATHTHDKREFDGATYDTETEAAWRVVDAFERSGKKRPRDKVFIDDEGPRHASFDDDVRCSQVLIVTAAPSRRALARESSRRYE